MHRRLTTLFFTLLVAFCLAPVAAQNERQFGGVGMSVYEHADFRGRNATFIDDMPDLRGTDLDRRISSIRVSPGETWQICNQRNFQGRCQVISGTEANLESSGWNDTIQSARRVQGGGRGGRGRGGNTPERGTLELFAGTQFSGRREIVTRAEPNLRRLDFNDRAASLRVAPGDEWEVCVNAGYDDCRVVDRDMPTLAAVGLNREISSVRPRPEGRRGGGRGNRRSQMILYDLPNYRGQSRLLTDDTPFIEMTANAAGSVRVVEGRWELCVQPRYGGRCVVVTRDVPDLSRLNLPGRVSSARIR